MNNLLKLKVYPNSGLSFDQNMSLTEIIIQKIHQQGPISFHDFMENALYWPGLGYYNSEKEKIGKEGDYYTSPGVSPVFGEMIGKQLEEMYNIIGEKKFTVVEMGAGTGFLSCDVLIHLKKNQELYNSLDYHIIEKSPSLRKEQKKRLEDNVTWHESIDEIKGITGCIFSNELVDAFPVHQAVMQEELMEVFVDYDTRFIEVLKPASKELEDYLAELEVVLPEGFRAEINLDATRWLQSVALSLEKGFLITIDYGYPSFELYREYRNRGTLMCYYRHTSNEDPYQHIGDQDITSHVNFSSLVNRGRKYGLDPCGFTDQAHFLYGLGIEDSLKELEKKDPADYQKKMLQVKSLLMEMGETFKILIQKKGLECKELSGLKYPSRWII